MLAVMESKEAILFAVTSANLYNFLGREDFENHLDFFKNGLGHDVKANDDLNQFKGDCLEILDPKGYLNMQGGKTPLLMTFHTGSFNLLVSHFLINSHQFYVLADTKTVGESDYFKLSERYRKKFNNQAHIEIINIEEPGAIFHIVKKNKAGKLLLTYIDGMTVPTQSKDNEKLMTVPFLNGRVRVRKEVPYISYLTDSPILLTLNYHEGGKQFLKVYDPIQSEEGEDKEVYCQRALSEIFEHFGGHVKEYTEQWAKWSYVHNWSDLSYFAPKEEEEIDRRNLVFDKVRFCPLQLDGRTVLFDRKLYTIFEIDENDQNIFSKKTSFAKQRQLIKRLWREFRKRFEIYFQNGFFVPAHALNT